MISNMIRTLSLLISLSSTALLAEASDISIRMLASEFHQISIRESLSELTSMSAPERRKLWQSASQQYFEDEVCVDASQPCSTPFLFCDSTPNQTGHERKTALHSMLDDQQYSELEELPVMNTAEETCFLASMSPEAARRLASSSCESDEKNCVIHPVVPMMKLSYGTVDVVTTTIENEEAPYLTVMAELSPYHKQNRGDISLESLLESTIELSEENCERQLADTLPSTRATMGCEYSLLSSEIEAEWMSGTTAAFYLSPSSEGETESELKEKILRFISGLAVRPEFSTVETTSSEFYYFYN
jgi:hypothetical protein